MILELKELGDWLKREQFFFMLRNYVKRYLPS
jgi:hypothetical protein